MTQLKFNLKFALEHIYRGWNPTFRGWVPLIIYDYVGLWVLVWVLKRRGVYINELIRVTFLFIYLYLYTFFSTLIIETPEWWVSFMNIFLIRIARMLRWKCLLLSKYSIFFILHCIFRYFLNWEKFTINCWIQGCIKRSIKGVSIYTSVFGKQIHPNYKSLRILFGWKSLENIIKNVHY